MQSYDVISIYTTLKIEAIYSWKSTFGFNNSIRLANFKSISTPDFDKILQTTPVLLILLNAAANTFQIVFSSPDWAYSTANQELSTQVCVCVLTRWHIITATYRIILPVLICPIDRHGHCHFAFPSLVPLVMHLRAKFDVTSSNRSRDMEGVPKFQK